MHHLIIGVVCLCTEFNQNRFMNKQTQNKKKYVQVAKRLIL